MNFKFDEAAHAYNMENGETWPSVTQILADLGFYGDSKAFFTEKSRIRGIYVHRIIQYYLTDELDEATIDETLLPYFSAWKQFAADTGFKPAEIEKPLINEAYKFAGTPDYIGMLNNSESVIDVKTGALGGVTGVQLAGYEILAGNPLKRYALQLGDTGKYKLTPFTDRADRKIFIGACVIWHWQRANNIRGN